MSQNPDSSFYIGPNIIEMRVLRRAEKLVEEGKTVHVHYHVKKPGAECNVDCILMEPEDE